MRRSMWRSPSRHSHEAGETLTLTYERGGKRYTAEVVLRESDT